MLQIAPGCPFVLHLCAGNLTHPKEVTTRFVVFVGCAPRDILELRRSVCSAAQARGRVKGSQCDGREDRYAITVPDDDKSSAVGDLADGGNRGGGLVSGKSQSLAGRRSARCRGWIARELARCRPQRHPATAASSPANSGPDSHRSPNPKFCSLRGRRCTGRRGPAVASGSPDHAPCTRGRTGTQAQSP